MDKLRLETPNLTAANIEKIAVLFPNVVTEAAGPDGKPRKAINFAMLKQMLSDDIVDGEECYEFTWVGKRASIVEAHTPMRKTLRPCVEESKNWETTENLYIEGDNLEVLKLLQESYLRKVKMIYIDPPYNTGKDCIYRDNYWVDKNEYEEHMGMFDEDDNRLFRNTESNGRFHSDWCRMIYPRLVLARNMLREDGVIFISIDDNEVHNLRKIGDEVFGADNFVANVIWQKKFSRSNDATYFSTMHDHILCYCKNNILINDKGWKIGLQKRDDEIPSGYSNPDNDKRGVWTSVVLSAKSGSDKLIYEITTPSGRKCMPPSGRYWSVTQARFHELVQDNRIWFGKDGDGIPRVKTFLSEVQGGLRPNTIWLHEDVGHNQEGKQETKNLFDGIGVFDGPKPVRLLKFILTISNLEDDAVVLDFFSGSATTAHAVMQLNAEDGGHRKFIMVQLPEPCAPDTEAFKAGYKNICEIGKERIRRAGEQIKRLLAESGYGLRKLKSEGKRGTLTVRRADDESDDPDTIIDGEQITFTRTDMYDTPQNLDQLNKEMAESLDIGFRVFKVDSTNMKDVYYAPADYDQKTLDEMITNIKEDRTDMDLLFGCLLEWGLPLSLPHKVEEIDGVRVHTVNDGDLIACFADKAGENVIREIARRQPLRAVFRDSSFATSSEKINVGEIFKLLAPNTSVKVI